MSIRTPAGTCCVGGGGVSRAPAFCSKAAATEHWPIVFWRWPRRLGAVTCYFYWTKSGNYLITSNYAARGAGLAAGGLRAPLWATAGSRGARWGSLVPVSSSRS